MQQLEPQIRYQNRLLRQLKREGLTAIYEVLSDGNVCYGYEVIRIKIAPAKEMFGKFVPEHEAYPSSAKGSNDWGDIAWSYGRDQKTEPFERYNGLAAKYRKADLKGSRALTEQTSLDLGIERAEGYSFPAIVSQGAASRAG
jgi:hypothetical protein